MADKTAHQRKADLKYCPVTLKEYLAGYKGTFSRDIDELWNTHDLDKNNYLDKEEARPFIAALVDCIDAERKQYYDPSNFDKLFKSIDENNDNFLSKGEMAVFIKKTFAAKGAQCCKVPNNTK